MWRGFRAMALMTIVSQIHTNCDILFMAGPSFSSMFLTMKLYHEGFLPSHLICNLSVITYNASAIEYCFEIDLED